MIHRGGLCVVRTVLLRQLLDAGAVHGGGVGEHGGHHVVLGQLVIFGQLDAAKYVGDAGDAQQGQLGQGGLIHAAGAQVIQARRVVEQPQQALGVLVVDVDDQIGVLHIVDPGDVLVADALDPVVAEAVFQDGGTLQRLAHRQLQGGVDLLEVIPAADGARAAAGEAGPREAVAGALDGLEHLRHGAARDLIMPQVVAHLLKLVEDHAVGQLGELVGLVEDLLHVALAAGGGDDLAGDLLQPLEALPAHARGQDGHGLDPQQLGVEGAAPAVVARGGPHGPVVGGVKLSGDQPGGQTAEGGAHLMAAGWEPLAHQAEDAGAHAGEGGGQLDVIGDGAVQPAGLQRLVFPRDAEQVQRVHVPQTHVLQPVLHFAGHGLGMLHVFKGGDDHPVLPGLLDVAVQARLVDGQVDHAGASFNWDFSVYDSTWRE